MICGKCMHALIRYGGGILCDIDGRAVSVQECNRYLEEADIEQEIGNDKEKSERKISWAEMRHLELKKNNPEYRTRVEKRKAVAERSSV